MALAGTKILKFEVHSDWKNFKIHQNIAIFLICVITKSSKKFMPVWNGGFNILIWFFSLAVNGWHDNFISRNIRISLLWTAYYSDIYQKSENRKGIRYNFDYSPYFVSWYFYCWQESRVLIFSFVSLVPFFITSLSGADIRLIAGHLFYGCCFAIESICPKYRRLAFVGDGNF